MLILNRKFDATWEYRKERTKCFTHGFHSYPAMFIPQVARRLITTYSKPGNLVVDIFCGSGTVLIESMLLNRRSIGIDINPLAIFLAKVKTTPLDPKKLQKQYFDLVFKIAEIKYSELSKPSFYNINYWFKESVIIELARIKSAIDLLNDETIKNFFLVAFSETVRRVSNMKSGEFKLVRIQPIKLGTYEPNVLAIFKNIVERNILGAEEFFQTLTSTPATNIILGDSSKDQGIKKNSVDCIITSPPYGDSRTTVAYGQFSRLSLQWLGLINDNELQIDNKLLGGKLATNRENLSSKYLAKTLDEIHKHDEKRALEVYSFYHDLYPCLQKAAYVLKNSGKFCIVMGNRTVKGVRIPSDFIISEICYSLGFKVINILVRNIPNKRMPYKNSPTNKIGYLEETMSKESIVILQKN